MAVPNRITLVTLGVADVERATGFYETLGWKRSSSSVAGDVAFFSLSNGVALSLYGLENLSEDASVNPEFRDSVERRSPSTWSRRPKSIACTPSGSPPPARR